MAVNWLRARPPCDLALQHVARRTSTRQIRTSLRQRSCINIRTRRTVRMAGTLNIGMRGEPSDARAEPAIWRSSALPQRGCSQLPDSGVLRARLTGVGRPLIARLSLLSARRPRS